MSRGQLIEVCGVLGIRTDHVAGGKRGSKDKNWLRTDIIERTAGPGLTWKFKNAAEADATCMRLAASYRGGLGPLLRMAQQALRNATTELVELRRLQTLKRRNKAEETRLSKSIPHWLGLCEVAQNLQETEAAMRDAGYDLTAVEADARALAMEQYQRHVARVKRT